MRNDMKVAKHHKQPKKVSCGRGSCLRLIFLFVQTNECARFGGIAKRDA